MRLSPTLLLLGLLPLTVLGGCDRGTYWYRNANSGDDYGIQAFYDQSYMAVTQPELVEFLQDCSVTRLYGSYGIIAEDDVSWMNWWLSQLHAINIKSYLLLDQHTWLDDGPDFEPLADAFDERMLDLLPSASVLSYWDGVHLDIEPQAGGGCSTQAGCYTNMVYLLELVTFARAFFDANLPYIKLYSDIWYRLSDIGTPPTYADAKVAWPGGTVAEKEAARDAWYAAFIAQLDGISVLAYDPDLIDVVDKTEYERSLATEVRIAVRDSDFATIPFEATGNSMIDMVVGIAVQTLAESELYPLNDVMERGGCVP